MDFTLNSNGILNASGLDVRARRLGVSGDQAWIETLGLFDRLRGLTVVLFYVGC